jgi:hypothetical protein
MITLTSLSTPPSANQATPHVGRLVALRTKEEADSSVRLVDGYILRVDPRSVSLVLK